MNRKRLTSNDTGPVSEESPVAAQQRRIQRARERARKYAPEGVSLAHELLSERRQELFKSSKCCAPGPTMRTELLRFNGAVERDPAIDAWMKQHAGELGAIAHQWFEVMRKCGDEVRELLHDGCPVASLGDAPFGYVNVFTSHVNVGFFHGASLPDPDRLLQGSGKSMRHVKLGPGTVTNAAALRKLIHAAYADIKARVEHG